MRLEQSKRIRPEGLKNNFKKKLREVYLHEKKSSTKA
jgi:hypothetical protein